MKISELIELSKQEITGGRLKLYTPDSTVWNFVRKGLDEVSSFFPLTKVITIKSNATEYVDIPSEEEPEDVVDVAYLEGKDRGFNFESQELFFAQSSYVDFGDDLVNWIRYERNLQAYKVLVGAEFEWKQSEQDKHRIYLDDVPNSTIGFTVKFTTNLQLPSEEPDSFADHDKNIKLPEPQATYLNRWLVAKIKLTEGGILGRFKPTGQAAETDAKSLKQEGKQELEKVQKEMKDRGFSLLSL